MGVRVPTSISIRLGLTLPSTLPSRSLAIVEPAVKLISIYRCNFLGRSPVRLTSFNVPATECEALVLIATLGKMDRKFPSEVSTIELLNVITRRLLGTAHVGPPGVGGRPSLKLRRTFRRLPSTPVPLLNVCLISARPGVPVIVHLDTKYASNIMVTAT